MSVNWTIIGATGEWAGAFMVVITLFYLANQVRQSTKMEKAVAQRDLLQRVSEWNARAMNNSTGEFDNFIRGLREYSDAPVSIQLAVDTYVAEFVFITEAALSMRKDGFFSDGTWAGIEGGALALLLTPGGNQWWQHGKLFVGHEIVEHLEKTLAECPAETPSFLDLTPTIRHRLAELDAEPHNSTPENPPPH